MSLWRKIMNAVGTEWCGSKGVPCDHMRMEFTDMGAKCVAGLTDDAFMLGLGYPSEWQFFMRRDNARKLAVWILWNWWICGEWFGLRRAIYYFALRRECQRTRTYATKESA